MKIFLKSLLFLISVAFCIGLYSQDTARDIIVMDDYPEEYRDERGALVIGVDNYLHIRGLNYAEADALLIKDILYNKGIFNVSLFSSSYRNPLKEDILKELDYYLGSAKQGLLKTFTFYFAGHGFQQNGDNYLAMMDIDMDHISEKGLNLEKELIPLFKEMMSYDVKILIFLDACRSKIAHRGDNDTIKENDTQGIGILFSTSEQEVSYEDESLGHGIYSYYLAEALEGKADIRPYGDGDNYVSFGECVKYVGSKVRNWFLNRDNIETGKKLMQTPRVSLIEWNGNDFIITKVSEAESDIVDNDDKNDTDTDDLIPSDVKASYEEYPDKIELSWNDVDTAILYMIYRSDSSDGDYTFIGNVTGTTFVDTFNSRDITISQEYFYKIQCNDGSRISDFSSVAIGKLCIDDLSCPSDIRASYEKYPDKIELSWNDVDTAILYMIYRSDSSDGDYTFIGNVNGTTFVDAFVTGDITEYFYKIQCTNGTDISGFSNVVVGKLGVIELSAPSSLIVGYEKDTSNIDLMWPPVNGASQYYIYRSNSKNGSYKYIGSSNIPNFSDSDVSYGREYYYKVKSISDSTESDYSMFAVGKLKLSLDAPINIVISSDADSISLSWVMVSHAEGYNIYRSTNKYNGYMYISTVYGTTFTDSGVSGDTEYYYKIVSVTGDVKSAFSDVAVGKLVVRDLPTLDLPYTEMISVKGGSFTMETNKGDSVPRTFSNFHIAAYETTYDLWYTVKEWGKSNGYKFKNAGREGRNGTDGAEPTSSKHEPVTEVSWRDCIVWCNAYSDMLGLSPVYKNSKGKVLRDSTDDTACNNAVFDVSDEGFRLPTEGEWQYAASDYGATHWTYASGASGYYNNSAATKEVAWYRENSYDLGSSHPDYGTHKVGTKKCNGLGAYDLSGNVWEWCWDWYAKPLDRTGVEDDHGPNKGSSRVLRGGSWDLNASNVQVGYRHCVDPSNRYSNLGFRVARRAVSK